VTELKGYHAHVYYDPTTRPVAERLRDTILGQFADDHSKNALWLGTPVAMRLEILRPTYRTELLPGASAHSA
jgi:aromatic ring-cleaving dioxygenase